MLEQKLQRFSITEFFSLGDKLSLPAGKLLQAYKIICSKYGVHVHFKGGNTLKNLLMFPKNKETITNFKVTLYTGLSVARLNVMMNT